MTQSADRTRVDAERSRLRQADHREVAWRRWGPYVSERAWGSVREDYSADGDAWTNFPFEHARSRTFRWNEDGLAGFCDTEQSLVPRACALERPRRDRQGAPVRPHQRPGQPRRRRQRAVLVRRRHPDPFMDELAIPLPAARVSLRTTRRREREAQPARTGVRDRRHRSVRRRPLLRRRGRLREGRRRRLVRAHHHSQRRARAGRDRGAADACGFATRGHGGRRMPSPNRASPVPVPS